MIARPQPVLAPRTALVTGGTRGIGAAIAVRLAEGGARVVITGRQAAAAQAAAASLGGGMLGLALDVTDEASVSAAFAHAREHLGQIDILVNNAGQAGSAAFTRTGTDLWQQMLAVNLTGTFLCIREALPGMMKAGTGRIINIASTAGLTGYPYVCAYTAAKHGVIGLTRALALEVARTGVTVNAVCPGYTDTDIVRDAVSNIMAKTGRTQAEALASLTASNPQGRLVKPEEVAGAVFWLCLESSASVTGQAIAVAGGEVLTG